jgi:uncharacterized protein (TIGR02147 family)
VPQTIEFTYQDLIKSEFENRISKNSSYSLRAFARDLSMTPQMLSAVLNKKKDLSVDSAVEIAGRLGLDPNQTQDLVDAVILASCKTLQAKQVIHKRIEERNLAPSGFKPLTLELFKAISDWYHFAILALTATKGFKSDPRWIASRLGISVFEAKEAISRLIALELLEEKNGVLKRTEFSVSALSNVPAGALRELARQLLTKGIRALEEQEQQDRDITNITMAADPDLLPEAKKMILQFRRKLCKFLESGNRTEVYVFSPALFRLTNKQGEKI